MLVGVCLALNSQPAAARDIATPSPRTESPGLAVSVRDGLLSVEAKEASWTTVLDALRQQTGIQLHLSIPLEGTVTVSCRDLPAEQALRCLFGREANFLFFYHASDSQSVSAALPSEVWVLGRGARKVAQTSQVEGKPAAAEALEDLSALLAEAKKEFGRNPQAARDAALHDPEVEKRLLAITHLGQQGDREALNVLSQIVGDPDPHIRQSAVEALGPRVGTDPQVRQALTRLMETAEDPEVRQLAADSLGIGSDLQTSVNADQ
ncbi:MAG: HEAT repeat domain-containing protein [Deltaproteobacteria bacterium]|nr:HEAT repeat domain-containing protein [Deltaproteobacteria bacterium]